MPGTLSLLHTKTERFISLVYILMGKSEPMALALTENSLSDISKVPGRLLYDPFEQSCDTLVTEFWDLIVNVHTAVQCFQFPQSVSQDITSKR